MVRPATDPAAPAPPRPVGLLAALLALALVVGWLVHYQAAAVAIASRYVRALGPSSLQLKAQTLTLQRAALRTADVLPIYGTSELYCCAGANNAGTFYSTAPTGFSVFNVGYPLTEDLFWAETFGALGNDLRGHKVVVSDSAWFLSAGGISTAAYAHTYQPEIADVFTFDAPVPLALRAGVAQRMLAFPTTLQGQSVLQAGLRDLAAGTWRGDAAYWLLDPAGRLLAWTQELTDARLTIQTLDDMGSLPVTMQPARWWQHWLDRLHLALQPPVPPGQPATLPATVPTQPRRLNWNALLADATVQAEEAAASNPFGVAPVSKWKACSDIQPVTGAQCGQALDLYRRGANNYFGTVYPVPKAWVQGVEQCVCWTDLNLEFEVLRSVGAQPMAWMQPIQGYLANYSPYSAAARRVVYDRYQAIAAADGVPATTFETHDGDPMFINSFGHMSQRGWIYADRLLNLFWHGRLGIVQARMAEGGSVGQLFPAALNCPQRVWCRGVDLVAPLRGELDLLPTG